MAVDYNTWEKEIHECLALVYLPNLLTEIGVQVLTKVSPLPLSPYMVWSTKFKEFAFEGIEKANDYAHHHNNNDVKFSIQCVEMYEYDIKYKIFKIEMEHIWLTPNKSSPDYTFFYMIGIPAKNSNKRDITRILTPLLKDNVTYRDVDKYINYLFEVSNTWLPPSLCVSDAMSSIATEEIKEELNELFS